VELCPGTAPPAVRDGRGRRRGYGSRRVVKLPRPCRSPGFVLHEVAHAAAPRAGHGPDFARVLLDLLVRHEGVDRFEASLLAAVQRPRRVRLAVVAPPLGGGRSP
jgi:hypothetical protein